MAMRARHTLIYLPFRAMAETTRLILAYGGKLDSWVDLAVWGDDFQVRRARGDFPWGKTPVVDADGVVVAQSGAIARYAGRAIGIYGAGDHLATALDDSVYELGQELCTINPLVNCFVGAQFDHVRQHYFRDVMPVALPQLERCLSVARNRCVEGNNEFFLGATPGIGDFNVFHHLDNAMLLEPDLLHSYSELEAWYDRMRSIPSIEAFLKERPVLNGIGHDPGLEDHDGVRITQRHPLQRCWLVHGRWVESLDLP